MTKQMMVILAVLVYLFILSAFVEPNSLVVTQYRVDSDELQGIRAVFLTDFHLKKHDYKRLDKIVKLTNQQRPDLVFMGGDFVSGTNRSKTMKPMILAQKLSLIDAPKYTVLGEQDWLQNATLLSDALAENGIRVLDDSNVRTMVKQRLVDIIGLSDIQTRNADITKAFKKTMMPRIVLTHNPDIYYNIMDDVTLILAGHTHGGQIVFPFTPPLFVKSKFGSKFASGLINSTRNTMIISKGLGVSGLPLRLNCKPEIVVIDFVRKGMGSR